MPLFFFFLPKVSKEEDFTLAYLEGDFLPLVTSHPVVKSATSDRETGATPESLRKPQADPTMGGLSLLLRDRGGEGVSMGSSQSTGFPQAIPMGEVWPFSCRENVLQVTQPTHPHSSHWVRI